MKNFIKIEILSGLSAFIIWGLFSLYFKLLSYTKPIEILAHRIIWSAVLTLVLVFILRRFNKLYILLCSWRTILLLFLSSTLVTANWFIYIWAVNNGHALDASLGFYIMPLMMLILGRIFFSEKLNFIQIISVNICLIAVLNLIFFYGHIPWVPICVSILFGCYGVIRKCIIVDPIAGLFIECILMTPFAIGYMIWMHYNELIVFGHISIVDDILLIILGIWTTVPLILFTYATTKIRLSTLGMMQYLNPTLQFLIAIFIFHEKVDFYQTLSCILIWCGLILFILNSFSICNKKLKIKTHK